MALEFNPSTGQYVETGNSFLNFNNNAQPAANNFGYTPPAVAGINQDLLGANVPTAGGTQPFTLFGAELGEIGAGLSGVGSVVSGFNAYNAGRDAKNQANRQWDLSLGNFANQAQTVNNQLESDIRTRLGNQGYGSGPELDALVAQELARTGVSSDPYAARTQGTNQTVQSNFLPSLHVNGNTPVQAQGQAPVAQTATITAPNTQRKARGTM